MQYSIYQVFHMHGSLEEEMGQEKVLMEWKSNWNVWHCGNSTYPQDARLLLLHHQLYEVHWKIRSVYFLQRE